MLTQETVAGEARKRPFGLTPSTAGAPSPQFLADAFGLMGAAMRFDQNAEIYGDDEPADYFYKVVRGAVRTYKLLSDGRRQISAFHLPGDLFGLEAGDNHRFTAEAVSDSIVLVVKRSALLLLAVRNTDVARELWTQTAGDLQRAQEHMLLLGRKNAQERVATFLLEIAGRISTEEAVDLPMSRQDIADYLGLTIETVSRTMTQLESTAAIELPTCRRILLRNRAALRRLNS
jgi:CRP/FNR family nitrogen fixation transcriptional regulator